MKRYRVGWWEETRVQITVEMINKGANHDRQKQRERRPTSFLYSEITTAITISVKMQKIAAQAVN